MSARARRSRAAASSRSTAADRPLVFAKPSGVSLGLLARGKTVRARSVSTTRAAAPERGRCPCSGMAPRPRAANLSVPATRRRCRARLSFEAAVPGRAAEGDARPAISCSGAAGDVRRVPFWGRVVGGGASRVTGLRALATRRLHRRRRAAARRSSRATAIPRTRAAWASRPSSAARRPSTASASTRRVANFGVVITSRGRGSRVEPRVVAGLDENRLTGYAGLPIEPQPVRRQVPRPASSRPARSRRRRASTRSSSTAPTRAGAGRFTFRFWVNDVDGAEAARAAHGSVRRAAGRSSSRATDAGAGIDPDSMVVSVDGRPVSARTARRRPGPDAAASQRARTALRLRSPTTRRRRTRRTSPASSRTRAS